MPIWRRIAISPLRFAHTIEQTVHGWLSRGDAQQNENGEEYCRQKKKKNNSAEGRVEPALKEGPVLLEQNNGM